ncbi:MAG: homoserine O-acetyltransferase [Bacteroidetes bacterium]|nr:homoserine O-acetyltransferase [Bacteroidota bacterium]
MHYFHYNQPFTLENGATLPGIVIAYDTYGTLNADKSNVVWICHHLTASSAVTEWWPGVAGEGRIINPEDHFIVCANILGSCYGSTGPTSINPATGVPYYKDFPLVTIRDMARAHILLRQHLELTSIHLLIGGSMGGYQAMEWAAMEPSAIRHLFLLSTSASESAWGIAVHTAQRLAIEADGTWGEASPAAGSKGMKAARGIGLLTYRNYGIMVKNQTDPDEEKLDDYRASSYINYQGEKLVRRFNAYSYWLLTKSMDSHHLGRGRGGNAYKVLQELPQKTLIIGVTSDILCPLEEQQFLAQQIPNATLVEIDSTYGHDGFMVESEKISYHLSHWLHMAPSHING